MAEPTNHQMSDALLIPRTSLLGIPPELRLLIYSFLWIPFTAHVIPGHPHPSTCLPNRTDLNLLLTCRQIYHEAHNTAYKIHTHLFNHHTPPHSTIPTISHPSEKRPKRRYESRQDQISGLQILTRVISNLRPHLRSLITTIIFPGDKRCPYPSLLRSLMLLLPNLRTVYLTVHLTSRGMTITERVMSSHLAMQAFRRRRFNRELERWEGERTGNRDSGSDLVDVGEKPVFELDWRLNQVDKGDEKEGRPRRWRLRDLRGERWMEIVLASGGLLES